MTATHKQYMNESHSENATAKCIRMGKKTTWSAVLSAPRVSLMHSNKQ